MLSSSARLPQFTYQTVVEVRYQELVEQTPTGWNFGRFVSAEEPLRGGFLPVSPERACMRSETIGAVVEWLSAAKEFHGDAKSSL